MKEMRFKKLGSIMIALMLTLMLTVIARAAALDTTTDATIVFMPGALIWGDLGDENMDQMNLDFGSHYRPTGAVQYMTVDIPHSISVEDAREITDGWNVTVSMSIFEANALPSFEGMVTLSNGVSDDSEVDARQYVEIISDGDSENVLSASVDADRGMFTTLWANPADVTLDLSETEALKVRANTSDPYSATLTWLLAVGPLP